jgi:hypothetical protein
MAIRPPAHRPVPLAPPTRERVRVRGFFSDVGARRCLARFLIKPKSRRCERSEAISLKFSCHIIKKLIGFAVTGNFIGEVRLADLLKS